jgi:phosphatase NudJ
MFSLTMAESRNRGWWLPGGFVECGDNLVSTAHKETMEEAGVEIVLKGILRIESSMGKRNARLRAIFYAHPADPTKPPKSVPDKESNGAAYVTIEQLRTWEKTGKLRGTELLDWAEYITNGGQIAPISFLTRESDPIPGR